MNTDRIKAEAIAKQYAPKETSKLMALKRLDERAKRPAYIQAISLGIVAALLLGVGMCLTMGVIGDASGPLFALGVVVGVVGIAGVVANYFVYQRVLVSSKRKYAHEIMKLANEIAGESE